MDSMKINCLSLSLLYDRYTTCIYADQIILTEHSELTDRIEYDDGLHTHIRYHGQCVIKYTDGRCSVFPLPRLYQ